jgi:hypothetical protein
MELHWLVEYYGTEGGAMWLSWDYVLGVFVSSGAPAWSELDRCIHSDLEKKYNYKHRVIFMPWPNTFLGYYG